MSDWFYRCGRTLLEQSVRLYYRRIELLGGERIPVAGPAIVVANHPNSVADAFLLSACLTHRKVNFIAKDSITRLPVAGWVVRRFGVVGVARAMDYERQRDLARQRNERAIGTCVPRLVAGEIVVIFGEGISTDARRLHMIRKGAMRFGYAAEQAASFQLGLLWVPVGISYSAKQRFRSDVVIRVGQPFGLADLHPEFAAHEPEVLTRGTARLQLGIGSLMVNVEQEELTGLIDRLAALLGNPRRPFAAQVESQQRLARAVEYFNVVAPQRLAALEQALRDYDQHLAAAGLTDDVVRQRHPASAFWTNLRGALRNGALMVLNLYGWANSFIPRWSAALGGWLERRLMATAASPTGYSTALTKEALWGTLGGWIGAAVVFPLQTYLVYRGALTAWGLRGAVFLAVLYALSLIPSWRLYIRRRDIFHQRLADVRDAARFLLKPGPAARLRFRRRRLERQLRQLLADYRAAGPRAA